MAKNNKYVSYNKWTKSVTVKIDILIKTGQLDGKEFENGNVTVKIGETIVDYDKYISCLENNYHNDNRNMKTYEKHLLKKVELE